MASITRGQASELLEVFGSCTTVYECMTVDELLTDILEFEHSLLDWADLELTCEEIRWDREGISGDDHDAWAKEVKNRVLKFCESISEPRSQKY